MEQEYFLQAFSFVIGLLVGSFANVLIARLPHNQSIVKPRSRCPQCKMQILWYDNIPVISYLILRGKCRNCSVRISILYPFVEILTGILFWYACVNFGWGPLLWIRQWPFLMALVAITFIDFEHRIIPDELSLGILGLGLLTAWFAPIGLKDALIGSALGFGSFYFIAWIFERLTGKVGMGGGDVKLMGMLGAYTGPFGIFYTAFASSLIGTVVAVIWAGVTRQRLRGFAIPYGPFLIIAALSLYFFEGEPWFQSIIGDWRGLFMIFSLS